jgi:Zinc finger, C3HC4 type (RING finger)
LDVEREEKIALGPYERKTCPVCLVHRRAPSALACGHVLCWTCALECARREKNARGEKNLMDGVLRVSCGWLSRGQCVL